VHLAFPAWERQVASETFAAVKATIGSLAGKPVATAETKVEIIMNPRNPLTVFCLLYCLLGLAFPRETLARETLEGKVIKAAAGKLTIVDRQDKNEQSHSVASDAVITCDGKACKLDDLAEGMWVKATTQKKGDRTLVTKIEAKRSRNP
jgi:hypothetical protein